MICRLQERRDGRSLPGIAEAGIGGNRAVGPRPAQLKRQEPRPVGVSVEPVAVEPVGVVNISLNFLSLEYWLMGAYPSNGKT